MAPEDSPCSSTHAAAAHPASDRFKTKLMSDVTPECCHLQPRPAEAPGSPSVCPDGDSRRRLDAFFWRPRPPRTARDGVTGTSHCVSASSQSRDGGPVWTAEVPLTRFAGRTLRQSALLRCCGGARTSLLAPSPAEPRPTGLQSGRRQPLHSQPPAAKGLPEVHRIGSKTACQPSG